MSRAEKWIYYSTIVMIFGNAFEISIGTFRFQLFYLVLAVNIPIMLLMKRLWAPKGLVLFIGYLLVSGVLGIFRKTDTIPLFFKEFLAVSMYSFYACSFFRTINFRLVEAFRLYAKMAYWTQIIGILLYPIQYMIGGSGRYHGLMPEPSVIAYIGTPALYYYADKWQKQRKHGREVLILLFAFVLAQSSIGYIGLLFAAFIFTMRYKNYFVLAPIISVLLILCIYETSSFFEERIDDTYKVVSTNDVDNTNLSTFALYTNFQVMLRVLEEHPIMGNGFGSHAESFLTYIGGIDIGGFAGTGYENINYEDASSFGIRAASDFGIFGILLMLWFIWRYRPRGSSELDVMLTAIYIYFFCKILRGGIYFSEEQYFFICFYALAPVAYPKQYSFSVSQTSTSA